MLGYGSDVLIPLWELIPNGLSHLKQIMEQEFQKYATTYYNTVMEQFTNPDIFETGFANIRNDEFTITDSGRYKQAYDFVDFCNWRMSLSEMKRFYNSATINIRIDVREVDDGYQYICLYKDSLKKDAGFITEKKYEFGSTRYFKKELSFNNIPLSNFHNEYNALYLFYSASGVGEDTWKNKDLYIQLVFNK